MLDHWPLQFPGCEPVAHRLRDALAHRWVRFHSLPESKRYPEHPDEYAELLARHNRVLGALAAVGDAVVLLTTGYSEASEVTPRPAELRSLDPAARPWRSVPMHELDGDPAHPNYWHVFASTWAWRPGVLDPVVRLVADDAAANVMIVAPDCRWLLHPYDGGMDVLLESPASRDRLRSSFAGWLSSRPDGL